MIPLIGYTDRWSAGAGESFAVKVSSSLATPYRADLVRILGADPNPAGPGIAYAEVAAGFAGTYPSRAQPVRNGSWARVAWPVPLTVPAPWTMVLLVQPWTLARRQTVLAVQDGPAITVGADGAGLALGGAQCQVAARMIPRHWYELRLVAADGRITLRQTPLGRDFGESGEAALGGGALTLGMMRLAAGFAPDGAPAAHFNGRIAHPMLLHGAHAQPGPLDPATLPAADLLAWWDFSHGIGTAAIADRGPSGFHGTLHNLPTRAVRGPDWDGTQQRWTDAPGQYAAIHFHETDLYDCEWETDFTFAVPPGLASGIYGIRLRGEGHEDVIPVFVTPPLGAPAARVALVMPTFTYQVYANYDRANFNDEYRARRAAWRSYPHHPAEHRELGLSTYDTHADGSGVAFSSLRRPVLTLRPGYFAYPDASGSGLRHFPADMHIAAWLAAQGIEFDVLTDHELDRDGAARLAPYRAVLTGTHPEYQTLRSLDAFQDYVNGGGRLCYLGGNGFYWRVATSPDIPDVLELRRAESGTRAWAAEPGEYYHAFDGTYGGLWRRNGRPPQMLTGVGFSAQGRFEGSWYRRRPISYAPDFAWMFAGLPEDEVLGDFGLSGGGAAGFELDRADPLLGTPPDAVVLATSEAHQPHFGVTPEELLVPPAYAGTDATAGLIRADMVYFAAPNGGAVFSVGSITFAGSLPVNGFDNPISRLLRNVVERFTKQE